MGVAIENGRVDRWPGFRNAAGFRNIEKFRRWALKQVRDILDDLLDFLSDRLNILGVQIEQSGGRNLGKIDFTLKQAEADLPSHHIGQVNKQNFLLGARLNSVSS